jgi:hypothetical protein
MKTKHTPKSNVVNIAKKNSRENFIKLSSKNLAEIKGGYDIIMPAKKIYD